MSPLYSSTDPRTKFIPRYSFDGEVAFESYCSSGHYIVFQNKTRLGFGLPSDDNGKFKQLVPFPGAYAYKSTAYDEQECYVAFDSFGNSHDEHLCLVNTSYMGTLITYMEVVENTNCDYTLLTHAKVEL